MVDREKVVLTTAKKLLAQENYDLVLCSEVDEALDIIGEKGPFAVVVSDNQLSAMRGTEFFAKLKGLLHCCQLAIEQQQLFWGNKNGTQTMQSASRSVTGRDER